MRAKTNTFDKLPSLTSETIRISQQKEIPLNLQLVTLDNGINHKIN